MYPSMRVSCVFCALPCLPESPRIARQALIGGDDAAAQKVIGCVLRFLLITNLSKVTEKIMSIKVGDRVPDGALAEFIEVESQGCSLGPNTFQVGDLVKGKTIALFAVPGAFTPTCSEKHLPGFLELADKIKAKGVDEIWCLSVNDPFVMGAWGRDQNVSGRVRMMADGSAEWTKKLGLELDLTARGLGVRSRRYSALIKDGVVTQLNAEKGGELSVSDAGTLLGQL